MAFNIKKNINCEMSAEFYRLRSFDKWITCNAKKFDLEYFARTGLFYDILKNSIKCHFCNFEKYEDQWKCCENPFTVHIKESSDCAFLKGENVGNIFIEDYVPKFPKYISTSSRILSFKQDIQIKPTHTTLANYGFFFEEHINCNITCYSCGFTITDWNEFDNIESDCSQYLFLYHGSNCVFIRLFYPEANICKNNKNIIVKNIKPVLNENETCIICYSNKINTKLEPCNHAGFCDICAQKFNKCPYCREEVLYRSCVILISK